MRLPPRNRRRSQAELFLREAGFHVRVYTVNDPASMAPHRAGLAGIITDHPPLYFDDPDWAAWEAGV